MCFVLRGSGCCINDIWLPRLSWIYVIGLHGIWIISENVGVTYSRVRSTRPTFDFRTCTRLSASLYPSILSLLNNHFNTFPLSLSLSLLNASSLRRFHFFSFFFFYKRRRTIRTFYSPVSIRANVRYYASVSRDNFKLATSDNYRSIVVSIRDVQQIRGKMLRLYKNLTKLEPISRSFIALFESSFPAFARIAVDIGKRTRWYFWPREITNRSTEAVQYRHLAFIYIVMIMAKCEWRQPHDNSALSGWREPSSSPRARRVESGRGAGTAISRFAKQIIAFR